MIELDGSYGEGGGAILRVGAGLAAALNKPIHIFNIRKNRPNPGLKAQHLFGLKAVSELCGGTLKGAELHSTEIEFVPGTEWKEKVKVQIPTAGSIGLVLQVLGIACTRALKPVKVEVSGGATYGKWAPSIDYLENVLSKHVYRMGYKMNLNVAQHGYYPKGGAKVSAVFEPPEGLKPLELLEQGTIKEIQGKSIASDYLKEAKVVERQKKSARIKVFNALGVSPKIKEEYVNTMCPGSAMGLWLETTKGCIIGSGAIGERGLRAEIVGGNSTKTLIEDYKAGDCVDRYAEDQLIPYFALCEKPCKVKIPKLTGHTETNIWVCERVAGKRFSFKNGILSNV